MVTVLIIKMLDKTIGLRVKEEQEEVGLDLSEHSEKSLLIDHLFLSLGSLSLVGQAFYRFYYL